MMLLIISANGCRMLLPLGGSALPHPADCLPRLSDPPPSSPRPTSLCVGPLGPESGGPDNFGQAAGPF